MKTADGLSAKLSSRLKKRLWLVSSVLFWVWFWAVQLSCLTINGEKQNVESGYVALDRLWQAGDCISLTGRLSLVQHDLNGKVAFTRGPLVLARDQYKDGSATDLTESIAADPAGYQLHTPDSSFGEMVRMTLPRADGIQLLLTDYASCGKHWDVENNNMTVWMNP